MLVKTRKLTPAEEIKQYYRKLRELYQFDALGYVVNVLNANPSLDQMKFFRDISEPGGFYAYSSGHHTGKSWGGGAAVDWLMRLYPESHTVLTADTESKVKGTIWKEVHRIKAVTDKRLPFLAPLFTLTDEKYFNNRHKHSWLAIMRASGDINKADTNFSGFHAKWLSFFVDEASGVHDAIFDAMDGTTTKETNRVILFSQRTKTTGRMHDAFGKLKKLYKSRIFDTERSPHVTIKEIKNYRLKFGGRHTDEYGVRVKGLEARQESGMLLSRIKCEELYKPVRHIQQPGYILICDPSGSGHRAKTGLLIAKVSDDEDDRVLETIILREIKNNWDSEKHTMDVANEIANIYNSGKYPNLSVGVDFIGVGHGVCHKLTELKIPHTRFLWGEDSWYKKRFRDQKMEGYEWLKEAVDHKRAKFVPKNHHLYDELMDQLDKLPFEFNNKGLKAMLDKKALQKLGIPSPDFADCYAMGFLIKYRPFGKTKTVHQQEIEKSIDLSWMDEL